MWCEAYPDPDAFWAQTPRSFEITMEAARARNEAQADLATATAYQTAAFNSASKSKRGLRPLAHYLPKRKKPKPNPAQMLGAMKVIASRVNRIFEGKTDGSS